MRLSKLEIQGFKSFAKRVEIRFDGKITAIVGPNGSGKSNVADAIRWVLGEQSAKTLRGTKMEDIIFNGADGVRAQGYCEVNLTFDNSTRKLPIEFSEVCITRRVYRSGESEYFLNQTGCRLKDIVDLFRDTGIGKEGYSIIGQGRVDEILSGKNEDRRAIFEEAAGVTKYKARKEDAEKKLARSSDNLIRLEDILSEIELQLEPLRDQSQIAKEYLALKEREKTIDLSVFLHQHEASQQRIDQYKNTINELEIDLHAQENQIQQTLQSRERQSKLLEEIEQSIEHCNQQILQATVQISQAESAAMLSNQQCDQLTQQKQMLSEQIRASQTQIQQLKLQTQQNQLLGEERKKALEEARLQFEKQQQNLQTLSKEILENEEKLESEKNQVIEAMNQIANSKIEQSRLEQMRESLQKRSEQIQNELQTLLTEKESVNQELEKEKTAENALLQEQSDYREQKNKLKSNIEIVHNNITEQDNQLQAFERLLNEKQSRLQILSDMKADYEGFQFGVRKLLQQRKTDVNMQRGIFGALAELIHVPEKFEVAIEIALGAALQNVVVKAENDAKYAIEYLKKNNLGRATFLPLTTMKAKTLNVEEKETLHDDGCFGIASEVIDFDGQFSDIISCLLGRVVLVYDLDHGIALAKKNRYSFRIVTLSGEVIHPSGSLSGGSSQKKDSGLLARTREIELLQQFVVSLKKDVELANSKKQKFVLELENYQQEHNSLEQEQRARELILSRQNEKIEMLQKFAEQFKKQSESFELEQQGLDENFDDISEQLRLLSNSQTLINESHLSQQEIQSRQEALALMRTKKEALLLETNQVQTQIALLEQQSESQTQLALKYEQEIQHAQMQIEKNEVYLRESKEKQEKLLEDTLQAKQKQIENQKLEQEHQEKLADLQTQKQNNKEKADLIQQEQIDQQTRLQKLLAQVEQMKAAHEKTKLEMIDAQQRIWETYELTFAGALPFKQEISLSKAQQELQGIKNALRELGVVNVQAIDDYQNVYERYTQMDEQRVDLQKAQADLQELIDDLMKNMRERFEQEFEKINLYFKNTFVELFSGGSAELRLSDRSDVMISNIEIIAQPPGKKLQLLSLLSGGERALTAIALLFAMLKLKPTPFCVLDEIEASLDEANVAHFAQYLKHYSDNTQFILITHRKGSMEVSDVLYGIAMEGKGVSKVLSVKIEDYQA